ncbi:RagB/SusD family nutrient uptake outer membrane protein [Marivirga atlantica]|uniref:RagB/SusD family nutrient uptake outer membrane protein n=1 Tax=Marivirga atlantica TaxID=1548457 RepID=A0A937AFX3_9BACT|nr:RagB/SusD family nutrient uptake outer membrane protein [Marivirga atlantica]MBL0765503.1 RagB/SusD family nutrient uptake outer membrane protein [Marivirga atlantica]
MKTLNYIILLFIGIFLSACFNDLNVEPEDPNLFLDEDFYDSPESYKEGLASVYANLSITGTDGPGSSFIAGLDAGTSQYGRGLWNLQTLVSDEAIWKWENDPGLRELNRTTWAADNVVIRGVFGRVMLSVAFANEYLRQTEASVLSERGVASDVVADIQVYRAEARFLRALSYYHMMDLFGKSPFILETDPVGAYQSPEYSRTQLFEFIESELVAIEEELLDPLQNEYGRIDKAAAWMLLAKLYLNAEVFIGEDKYTECVNYCEQIINSVYDLSPNYLDLFRADNNTNSGRQEIIFPIISDGTVVQNYGPTTVAVNGQIGAIESNGAQFGVSSGGWGGALRVTQQFSETFINGPYSTDDRNTLLTAERNIEVSTISDDDAGYVIQKWSNVPSTDPDNTAGKNQEFADIDFPMFRLADVYLMYAEAHLRGGGGTAAEAASLINALRARANNPELITTADLTLDLILDERLVELYWEAHRRQDLIRFESFTGARYNWAWKGNSPDGAAIDNYRGLYPIPTQSLGANQNLTQNEGY